MTETSAIALATAQPITSLTIRRPDDWHVHFRDNATMRAVLPYTAKVFGRAVVMPNLMPPVTTVQMAHDYRQRIMAMLPPDSHFDPLMTLYLTDHTDPHEITMGKQDDDITAAKLYPANATTGSAHGVTDVLGPHMMKVYERMAAVGMPLLIHGEVTDPEVDIFDREKVFIDRVLDPLRFKLPELTIVLEHVTTEEAVQYVSESWNYWESKGKKSNLAATITPHHLVINRNAIFQGGIRPHLYCLPIAKREKHRLALRKAATSGLPCFFLGTDSAPHAVDTKETECGCAGIFCAPTALETYAEVFEEENALDKFESFASLNGPAFYDLPPNEERITLVRESWEARRLIGIRPPNEHEAEDSPLHYSVQVFRGGETLRWKIAA